MNETQVAGVALKALKDFSQNRSIEEIIESGLNIDDVYSEVVYPETDAYVIKNADLKAVDKGIVLGKYILGENLILLDRAITEKHDPRYAFVFAHEIGHVYFSKKTESCFIDGFKSDEEDEKIANCFAKHFVMPGKLVQFQYNRLYNKRLSNKPLRYIGPREYWFNNRKRNISSLAHFCWEAANGLTMYFSHVSNQAMGIRLMELGLIQNDSQEIHRDDFHLRSKEPKKLSDCLAKAFSFA
jgi:hypothetical protein